MNTKTRIILHTIRHNLIKKGYDHSVIDLAIYEYYLCNGSSYKGITEVAIANNCIAIARKLNKT